MKLIAATNNPGKIREIQEILGTLGFSVMSLKEAGIDSEPEENGATFEENALIKARAAARLCDCAVAADDSGLCVDALDGRPGVYSARYAGEGASDAERIQKLLEELAGEENRAAKFVTAVALILPDGTEMTVRGEVHGTILQEACGTGGFGYDPVFFSEELGKTFGEADAEEKNRISHRARAFRKLCEMMKNK